MKHKTLMDMFQANRDVDRAVTYVEGENVERRVSFADVYARALGILYHLQALGAQRGDKIIIFLNNNEQFLDGFWAALTGGIIPVPLAVGISDEHRLKLLRVARKLGKPYLYTDSKNLERLRALAAEAGESELMADLASRCFLVESITDISRPGRLERPDPSDLAFIQFSSGSTSEPKGVMLTHGNLMANIEGATAIGRYSEQDVTLSWMPLTHDMGLIGFYLVLFTNRSHINLMPTDLFVRRPLLWLQTVARKRVTLTCSPISATGTSSRCSATASSRVSIYRACVPSTTAPSPSRCRSATSSCSRSRTPGFAKARCIPSTVWPKPVSPSHSPSRAPITAGSASTATSSGIGSPIELNPVDARDVIELMCVGRSLPNMEMRIADDARAALPRRARSATS